MASLGCHVEGASLLKPDPSDPITTAAGAMYRFCRHIPHGSRTKFRLFVQRWLKNNMVPLAVDADDTFETWIRATPYSNARKDELRAKFQKLNCDLSNFASELLKVKSFVKDEAYEEPKHARGINSRTDEFKCLVGPMFQLISVELFKLPCFIKKIPIEQRPDYIINMLYKVGATYIATDYTSFEAHFDAELFEDCEMQLYEYMVSQHPNGPMFMSALRRAFISVPNKIFFKLVTMVIVGKRMSGEMNTSLGNGFSNYMFMLYLCEENGNTNVAGTIEGDDGLFSMEGPALPQDAFIELGLNVKMDIHKDLNLASFCGMVFDLVDRTNITNPIVELVNFGWTGRRYAHSSKSTHMCLLRCKAQSLAYQYPRCPILSAFARKICELTSGYDSMSWLESQTNAFNQYELEMVRAATKWFSKSKLDGEPGTATRLLVEQLYGITTQQQLKIEEYICSLTSIEPLNSPHIAEHIRPVWNEYYERYSIVLPINRSNIPGMRWPKVREPADFSGFLKPGS